MGRYTVVLTFDPETDSYAVTVPALAGCFTQGQTVEEALANAKEAITLHLDALAAQGEPLPDDVSPLVYMLDIEQTQLAR
jgi:antitoxin HicB